MASMRTASACITHESYTFSSSSPKILLKTTRIRLGDAYIRALRWRSQSKASPAPGFIEPCIPTVAKVAPTDDRYVFEIKYDG